MLDLTSRGFTHLLRLAGSLGDPLLCVVPVSVELEEASLSSPLDELVGLGNELRRLGPRGQDIVRGDGVGSGIPGDLSDLGRRRNKGR